jgi:hypothetical protein
MSRLHSLVFAYSADFGKMKKSRPNRTKEEGRYDSMRRKVWMIGRV